MKHMIMGCAGLWYSLLVRHHHLIVLINSQPVVLVVWQVTTLQYGLVDNCTIMRVDNGEILDIIYTTDSLLVTTPRGSQISLVVAKNEAELFVSILTNW